MCSYESKVNLICKLMEEEICYDGVIIYESYSDDAENCDQIFYDSCSRIADNDCEISYTVYKVIFTTESTDKHGGTNIGLHNMFGKKGE